VRQASKLQAMVGVALALAVSACGDPSPSEQCEDLLQVACERAVECLSGATTVTQCVSDISRFTNCQRVTEHFSTYEPCHDQLEDATCSALVRRDAQMSYTILLPAVCGDVIPTQ
jgi:hypothetical protein